MIDWLLVSLDGKIYNKSHNSSITEEPSPNQKKKKDMINFLLPWDCLW